MARVRWPLIVIPGALALYVAGSLGRFVVAGGVVLFAPGYILWYSLRSDLRLPRYAAPAIWLGLSLSLIPLVFLWSSAVGLRLLPSILRVQMLGVGLLAAWAWSRTATARPAPRWLTIGFFGLIGLIGLTRWLEISSMPIGATIVWSQPRQALAALGDIPAQLRSFQTVGLPLWVDSVHHTLLVRVIGETGRIPTSLEPYLPVPELIYHWGYHTVAATWRAVADLPLATAVLWSGQVLNAAIGLGVYALAAYVLRSPLGGLVAALAVGLFSFMPAYYVTWGRYTQLTGLLLLPSLLIVSMALAERPRFSWRLVIFTAVLLAGLMLVHYRVLVFYAAFMLPYAALLVLRRPRSIGALIGRFAAVSLAAALLALPWVLIVVRRVAARFANTPSALAGSDSYNGLDLGLLRVGHADTLYIIAAIGVVLALARWRWRVVSVALWIGLLFVIANPTIFGLPSSWFINNHSVAITIFMPVGVLVGGCVQQVLYWLRRWSPTIVRRAIGPIGVTAFVALAIVGTWQMRTIINQQTVLAQPSDIEALEWAATNTPPDARFLVNTTHWLNGSYRGTDAGWWLLPIAGRWVSTPPAMYIYGSADYKRAVEAYNQRVAALQPADQTQLRQLIRDGQITHVFIGSTSQGPLRADLLLSDPLFEPIYEANGAVILAVRDP